MVPAPFQRPILASTSATASGDEEYWWHGEPGKRGAVLFRTDRYGQRWTLDIDATHWVTQRVAAGLLGVSVMTVNNWIRDGRFAKSKQRTLRPELAVKADGRIQATRARSVSVVPLREVERIAEARGIFIRRKLTSEQRKAIRAVSMKRRKGGEGDANEGGA